MSDYRTRFRERFDGWISGQNAGFPAATLIEFLDEVVAEECEKTWLKAHNPDTRVIEVASLVEKVEGMVTDETEFDYPMRKQDLIQYGINKACSDILTHLRGETFNSEGKGDLSFSGQNGLDTGSNGDLAPKRINTPPVPQEKTECCRDKGQGWAKLSVGDCDCPCHKPRTEWKATCPKKGQTHIGCGICYPLPRTEAPKVLKHFCWKCGLNFSLQLTPDTDVLQAKKYLEKEIAYHSEKCKVELSPITSEEKEV